MGTYPYFPLIPDTSNASLGGMGSNRFVQGQPAFALSSLELGKDLGGQVGPFTLI
jgi:hypothetical protein